MGGIAAIAREAGHRVTGSDSNVYPPMSDQLRALDIELIEGFDPGQLDMNPDVVVIGNVMSRGMPIVEQILNKKISYTSGPAWLAEHVLRDQHVIAVSGTHGKTTTTAMTAWLLEAAGVEPGYLIGGVAANFSSTARLGTGKYFVIEADEYDTAFFDKRAKFMHYGPQTLIINNLEFDHADIYKDMDAILWQFHQMLRILPGNGRVIAKAGEVEVDRLLEMGCWTQVESYAATEKADWVIGRRADSVTLTDGKHELQSPAVSLPGTYNLENAAAALLAAKHVGLDIEQSLQALASFRGVKRRLEHLGRFNGVNVYDDFAHHPTAIARTIEALHESAQGRVLVVLEPRSNSMKLGAHRAALKGSLLGADKIWLFQPAGLDWSLEQELADLSVAQVHTELNDIVNNVAADAQPGDEIVIMSNGGFGGIHALICKALDMK
jgi:UDP-N-acetylmuramate: L-alanyl-gamma-D-glutamyl-meso-diaminopimelate ligase